MSEHCDNNCSSCGSDCGERREPQSFLKEPHELSHVRKVIGVVSGKGGVGKSLVTSLMAVEMQRRGYRTAILDADITGPSIPKVFGIHEKAKATNVGTFPLRSAGGTEVMSINLLLPDETDPVVWRGPMIAGAAQQFWTDVIWEDVDYMFVDMPPGTGDVPLTIFQSLPVAGIIVVTAPQQLVSMIVGKAVKMAAMLQVPVLGIVENMSYFECPDCGGKHAIFGDSHLEELAEQYGIGAVARIPIQPALAAACDLGAIEGMETDWLKDMADLLERDESTAVER